MVFFLYFLAFCYVKTYSFFGLLHSYLKLLKETQNHINFSQSIDHQLIPTFFQKWSLAILIHVSVVASHDTFLWVMNYHCLKYAISASIYSVLPVSPIQKVSAILFIYLILAGSAGSAGIARQRPTINNVRV